MASAGTVTLELDANSVKMIRELQKAQKTTKRTATRMKRDMANAFNAMAKSATVLGAAMVAATKVAVDYGDKIGKTSKAVGLTAEQFQEFAFAAKRAGIEQGQFSSNMVAFVKRVGEAQAGMGPLVSGLKNLNPTLLENLKNTTNQADAFRLVADAIKDAKSDTEAAAIANAAFSRSGVTMVNMMRDGADGLDKMAEKARDLGIVLDDRLVANAEETADKMGDLQMVLKTSISAVVLENADAIGVLINTIAEAPRFLKWAKDEFKEFFGVIEDADFVRRDDEIAELQSQLETAREQSEAWWRSEDNIFKARAASLEKEIALKKQLLEADRAAAAEKAKTPNELTFVDPVEKRNVEVFPDFGMLEEAMALENARLAAEKINEEIAELQEQIDTFGMDAEAKQIRALQAMGASPEAIEQVRQQYEQLRQLQEAADIANAELEEVVVTAKRITTDSDKSGESMASAMEMMGQSAMGAFESMASGATSAKDAVKSLIKEIAMLIIKQLILKAIGGGTVDTSSMGGIFGGARAAGGSVNSGETYLVGEKGPELLTMGRTSGYITPNNKLGGSGVTVNVDARESRDPSHLMALVPLIQEQVESSIALKMRRGYL